MHEIRSLELICGINTKPDDLAIQALINILELEKHLYT